MDKDTLYVKRKRPTDMLLLAAIYISATLAVALLLGIILYVFVKGIHTVNWAFLTTVTSARKQTTGIAGNLLNTLYIIVITLLIATPIGVGSAIYLNEYAKPGKLVSLIEFTTEILSGIPSIIFGLFGMIFFGETLGFGYSLLTGSFTLTLMVLPLITRNTQEALRTVPDSYRTGALGMGSTKWHMIRTILLPSSMPGIVTGIILALGRIVGESAALLFTAGSDYKLPKFTGAFGDNLAKLAHKAVESGGTLTIELYLQMQKGQYDNAFGIGCVLIVIVLILNLLTKMAANKLRREYEKSQKGETFMANSKITVESLNLHYGENHALKNVNMEIADHAITAFIGPSGCGKSTFLRCLNRMNDLVDGCRVEGKVILDGEDIYDKRVDTTLLRKKVGMVFQQPNPFPMSIYDNIGYGPRLHGIKNKKELDEIVERSLQGAAIFEEVKDRLHKSALGLSGGQQQRLCIARALAVSPEVLLMDEPTSALDPISTLKIEELMETLKKKYTVVIVTHNMQQAARVSDDTAFFLVGEVVEKNATSEIFARPRDKRTEDYITGRFG